MFGLGLATKIFIAIEGIDMRKGFEGLHGLVRDHLGARPVERTLVLVHQSHAHPTESAGVGWERIVGVRETFGKRPFSLAGADQARSVTMRAEELAMLVNGLDWNKRSSAPGIARALEKALEHFREFAYYGASPHGGPRSTGAHRDAGTRVAMGTPHH